MAVTLRLVNVTKDYVAAEGAPRRAVTDLSLDIPAGTFCTLLGPSGCGKTTLLRLIAGFEQPTRGDVVYAGTSLNAVPPYRRGFPMVFQSYALFPHMTVLQNVEYGLRVRGVDRSAAAGRAEQALDLLGLAGERSRHPAQLSGGQQQRVALARCLVLEPQIILFDEPLSNLDAELRVSMRREIRSLQQRLGITAVYVTHDQEEALAVSDTIVVLNAGRIEQVGTPREVFERPRTEFVARFMGAPNIVPVEAMASHTIRLLGVEYEHAADPRARLAVIRSDAVVLAAADGRHAAVVEECTYLGTRTQYVLRLVDGGERIVVDAGVAGFPDGTSGPDPAPGRRTTLKLLPHRLHYLT